MPTLPLPWADMVGRNSNNRFRAKTIPCGTVHTPVVSMLPFLVLDAHRSIQYACLTHPPAGVSTNRTLLLCVAIHASFGRDNVVNDRQLLCEKSDLSALSNQRILPT